MTAVRRRCACATVIEAEADPVSIEHAVTVHNQEPEHVAWRTGERLRAEQVPGLSVYVRPTANPRPLGPMVQIRRVS